MQIKIVLFLIFQSELLLFLFLPHCLGWILQYNVNRNGESEHLCLVPDLMRKTLILSPIKYDLGCAVWFGFVEPFIGLREFTSIPHLLTFFIFKGFGFCQMHILQLLRWHVFYASILLIWYITLINFRC